MKKILVLTLFVIVMFASCENEVELINPIFNDASILEETKPVSAALKKTIEGVYQVTKGSKHFGKQVVLKWNRGRLSIFGSTLGIYFILKGGIKDSTLFLEGKWRYAVNTEAGLARLFGNYSNNQLKLSGTFGNGSETPATNFELSYVRPFRKKVIEKDFYIIAHRAGGRNSDYVGASENSIEILPYAEYFGANGVEIDVKLSKDNIPFIYHDETINLRTTKDSPIWGDIEKFTFKQLRTFVLLKNGERLPTLLEMLEYILEETELKCVWLDMKSEKNAMPIVIKIQKIILDKAKNTGRNLEIFIGLPSKEKQKIFMEQSNFENIPSLCELGIEETQNAESQIWAPRWTLGTQIESVEQMHNEGRRVFTWTLDQTAVISEFINVSKFDGILTNYPTIVAYFYYVQ